MADGAMRVWWMPKIPAKNGSSIFYREVVDLDQALILLMDLESYSRFLAGVFPDLDVLDGYLGGLEIMSHGEWVEWENDDGQTIDDLIQASS